MKFKIDGEDGQMNHALSLAYYRAGQLACWLSDYHVPGAASAYCWLMGKSVRHDRDGKVWRGIFSEDES